MVKTTVSDKIKLILGITSSNARWGIFAILFAIPFSIWAFAFSFYCLYKWGGTMNPAIWLNLAIAFGVFGFAILAVSILLGTYWYKHPHKDVTLDILTKLTSIESTLVELTNEIRGYRDERNKSK